MEYNINKQGLLQEISIWGKFLKKKVHLIACGGTALTLLGLKASTKDIDLIVPVLDEYDYLLSVLKELGYKPVSGWGWGRADNFIFDLFRGKSIHTTELLESPLDEGNNILVKEFNAIYLGVLNYYDILISKLFRATQVDIDDCLRLVKSKRKDIDLKHFERRFRETASYDISEDKVNKNFDYFIKILEKEGVINEKRQSS